MISRSGGLFCEASDCNDESEFADPGGSLMDDNDKGEGKGDFAG